LNELEHVLASYLQIGIDLGTAETWAALQAKCLATGKNKPHNDLWIAATALQYGFPVASRDAHFKDIPGIRLIDGTGIEEQVTE